VRGEGVNPEEERKKQELKDKQEKARREQEWRTARNELYISLLIGAMILFFFCSLLMHCMHFNKSWKQVKQLKELKWWEAEAHEQADQYEVLWM